VPTQVYIPNGISVGLAVFAQLTAEGPCTLQWAAPFPSKISDRMGNLNPHLIYGSMGPPESTTQTTFDRFSRFCGAHDGDRHTYRPTDHATPGITIGHTYIVLRCGVIIPPLNYLDLIASNNTDAIYDSAFAYYWTYPLKLK